MMRFLALSHKWVLISLTETKNTGEKGQTCGGSWEVKTVLGETGLVSLEERTVKGGGYLTLLNIAEKEPIEEKGVSNPCMRLWKRVKGM